MPNRTWPGEGHAAVKTAARTGSVMPVFAGGGTLTQHRWAVAHQGHEASFAAAVFLDQVRAATAQIGTVDKSLSSAGPTDAPASGYSPGIECQVQSVQANTATSAVLAGQ
jgi:hypothetical protein